MPTSPAPAFFEARQLAKHFGGIQAVADLSLDIARGEIVGLIGPNGSGKTTTINMLAGALRPDQGAIALDGHDLTEAPAHTFARGGVARTFQVPRLFRRMTVLENLVVPALSDRHTRRPAAEDRAYEVLEFLRLGHLADEFARALSGGQQKLLEVGRALMLDPKLILLDEPFAGVHPRLLDQIIEHIKVLNQQGMTIVLVDHNLDAIRSVVRRTAVMAQGSKIADGPADEVLRDPAVIHAYTGSRKARGDSRS
ncbi:MAG: ABC transporter ATP-binding protein [Castellaniella sp.]|nr:ABC transporter ATP-binding protein [Castellaniella sp.]